MISITVVLKDSTLLIKHTQWREPQTRNFKLHTKKKTKGQKEGVITVILMMENRGMEHQCSPELMLTGHIMYL